MRLPSIFLLILSGILIGPVLGLVDTDELFGPLFSPIISVSVAIILFEGGLGLNMADLKKIGKVVQNLLTFGILFTWAMIAVAAYYILKLDVNLSILLGAILIVTGPTVISPLMRHIRPVGSISSILRWEGIVIDPIGVMLAVLVFEVILIKNPFAVPLVTVLTVLKTIIFGGGLGFLSSWIIIKMFRKNLVPHYLQNAFTLMAVVGVYAISSSIQKESGLLAVTVMGIFFASQKDVVIEHIVEFKENLQVLLIPTLFVVLASRLKISELQQIDWDTVKFLAVLILIVRPVSVLLSTLRNKLHWRQRVFLCWMAPRGIVAAAMASVIALQLSELGVDGAHKLVPTVFFVIMGTVLVYGFTAGPLAYALRLADPNPQGILFIGGEEWVLQLALILKSLGIKTLIVDTNSQHIQEAKAEGIEAKQVNILAEHASGEFELNGLGRLLAVTTNEEVNSMAAMRFAPAFGKQEVYQLSSEHKLSYKKKEFSAQIRGRILFSAGMTCRYIQEQFIHDAEFKIQEITSERDIMPHAEGPLKIPLFIITPAKSVKVFAADNAPTPKSGDVLIYLESKYVQMPNKDFSQTE